MRVDRVSSAYDTLRPHMYYAGTHLTQYSASHYQDLARQKLKTRIERSKNQKEAEHTLKKETKTFTQHFIEHQEVEKKELLKRLNYVSGVHFSQLNKTSNDT